MDARSPPCSVHFLARFFLSACFSLRRKCRPPERPLQADSFLKSHIKIREKLNKVQSIASNYKWIAGPGKLLN